MATYQVEANGSCTTFITRTYIVEAESEDDARDKVNNGIFDSEHIAHDIDDDYSEIDSIEKL